MNKRIIVITGTPCTGKTSIASQLTAKLDALCINLTEFAKNHNLIINEDKERNTGIIDEKRMRVKIAEVINATDKKTVIVDGHYAAAVVPKSYLFRVFVLRRNPIELRKLMQRRGFSDTKILENLASEILDVCLVEALQEHGKEKICELDITGKTVEAAVNEIVAVLNESEICDVGHVDWLGLLEKEGLLDEFLKF